MHDFRSLILFALLGLGGCSSVGDNPLFHSVLDHAVATGGLSASERAVAASAVKVVTTASPKPSNPAPATSGEPTAPPPAGNQTEDW